MSRKAMQVALDALESDPISHAWLVSRKQAITALRQALEKEPFEYWSVAGGWVKLDEMREHFNAVGCGTIYKSAGEGRTPLYTAQPKQWVGLTDEDIHDAFNFTEMVKQLSWDREPEQWCKNFAACIEAKIKDKNHG